MVTTLETNRLILREFQIADLTDLYEYAKNPNVGPNAGWTPHKNIVESEAVLNMFMKEDMVWAIVYKADNRVIGSIGLHTDSLRSSLHCIKSRCLGYALSYDYWGHGITTEAVKEIQRYAFLELGLDIMAVDHYPNNRRSMRVIEKCGFRLEGTIRMGRPDYEGKPTDIVCYSILKDEWMKNNKLI